MLYNETLNTPCAAIGVAASIIQLKMNLEFPSGMNTPDRGALMRVQTRTLPGYQDRAGIPSVADERDEVEADGGLE